MTKLFRVWLSSFLMIYGSINIAFGESNSRSPEAIALDASKDLMLLVHKSGSYTEENTERLFIDVEALLSPVVDFESFARGVMAVHYKRASEEQRMEFVSTFRWGLVRTYALALTEFADGELSLVPNPKAQRNPRYKNVKMQIRTKSGDVYPLIYVMRLGESQGWRLANLIVNGINIGLTYRSQFASALQKPKYKGDLGKLIDDWADVIGKDDLNLAN